LTTQPAPYPTATRAKGWRFELDYEQIEQSDTWALAGPEARPWLLMLWMMAWKQVPCGTLPNEPAVIAAMIGMPAKAWARHGAVLLRGWWLADNGRLYHATLARRVEEMMSRRKSDADRKARERARKEAEALVNQPGVTPESRGTTPGLHPESSTDNRIPNTKEPSTVDHHDAGGRAQALGFGEVDTSLIVGSFQPTQAGALCRTLRQAGIADVNPGHPRLLALLQAGAQPSEFVGFVGQALDKAPRNAFAYLLGVVEGERTRATATAGQLHRGPMPNRQEAIEQRNAAVGDAWLAQEGAA
jgi:hypothetical protein